MSSPTPALQRHGPQPLPPIPMVCDVAQELERAVRARAVAEGLTMPEAQRAALRAWADASRASEARS